MPQYHSDLAQFSQAFCQEPWVSWFLLILDPSPPQVFHWLRVKMPDELVSCVGNGLTFDMFLPSIFCIFCPQWRYKLPGLVQQLCWAPAEQYCRVPLNTTKSFHFLGLCLIAVSICICMQQGNNSHHLQSPLWVEGINTIQLGAGWCPKGNVHDTAIPTPVSWGHQHDALHLGWVDHRPCQPCIDITSLSDAEARCWLLEGL